MIRSKIDFAEAFHFQLIDIVDPCYKHGILSQVDVLLVKYQWVLNGPDLVPWKVEVVCLERWHKFE